MTHKATQRGISLVEIMIALVLGLVLTSSILQVFSTSKQTYRMQGALSRLQANGRFAMDFITRDIRKADYTGCLRVGINDVTNNLNPAGTGYNADVHGFSEGIGGTNGATNANPALNGRDTLILRGAIASGLTVQAPYGPQASANVKIPPGNGLQQGDIVLLSDCEQGDIFQISNANPSGGGVAVHNTGAVTDPGNYNATNPGCPGANAHCLSKVYQDDAQIYVMRSSGYSIATGASGEPALFRTDNGGTTVELAEGVQNMQLLFGEDTGTDGNPDYYVPADQVTDMDNVVSIRVSLLLRTDQDFIAFQPLAFTYNGGTTTPTDRRIRRVFTATVAVRNRLL